MKPNNNMLKPSRRRSLLMQFLTCYNYCLMFPTTTITGFLCPQGPKPVIVVVEETILEL